MFARLRRHIARFLQVGALGFAVDASLLGLCIYQFDLPPVLSRVISFVATISVTFYLNARYTFEASAGRSSMAGYIAVQCLGALINFSSYTWLVLYGGLGDAPLAALVVGSILSTISNFALLRRFVFRPPE